MGSKRWESDALLALNVQAPDVAGNFATNLHKTTHHKSADEQCISQSATHEAPLYRGLIVAVNLTR
jgi:hypothetical protein